MKPTAGTSQTSTATHPLRVLAVIPARYASTRFPGKPLAVIAGKPMIQRVYGQVQLCRDVDAVVVATDDERILHAVETFGGKAVMTSASHSSGTERIAEVAQLMKAEIYVNVQGDEPLIAPQAISAAVQCLLRDDSVQVATLCVPISQPDALSNPNVVKVVCDSRGDALYFSRFSIPFTRGTAETDFPSAPVCSKHIGLYAFRRAVLLEFPKLPRGPLEQSEQLEQLRLLENGIRIRVIESAYDSVSVDAPEDVARVEQLLRGR